MTIDAYLYLFTTLLREIVTDKELISSLEEREDSVLCSRINSVNTISSSEMQLVRRVFYDSEALRQRLARKNRLCDRYAVKLSRAINSIRDARYRDFLILRYMHDYSIEEIAEKKHYAERSLYRIGCSAKLELKKQLLLLSPKPQRTGRQKMHVYSIVNKEVIISCSARLNAGKTRRAPFYPHQFTIGNKADYQS